MSKIQLLLVDDHDIVRKGIRMLLESYPEIDIAGEASSAAEALELAGKIQPDVVVMDITLPDLSGIEATRLLKEKYPDISIVALTIHEDDQYFYQMLQVGASGYIPKRAASEDLVRAIQAASIGEVYIYPSLAKTLVNDFLQRPIPSSSDQELPDITHREQEVLEFLVEGMTNAEIGDKLEISRHTVARHRENLMRKLGLHSRSELVKYAIRKGLISA